MPLGWTTRKPGTRTAGIQAGENSIFARQPAGASWRTTQPASATVAGIRTAGTSMASTSIDPARAAGTLVPSTSTAGMGMSGRSSTVFPGPGAHTARTRSTTSWGTPSVDASPAGAAEAGDPSAEGEAVGDAAVGGGEAGTEASGVGDGVGASGPVQAANAKGASVARTNARWRGCRDMVAGFPPGLGPSILPWASRRGPRLARVVGVELDDEEARMPYVTIPGDTDLQLYYEDSGGDGRPVVLIHGWPLSGEAWAAQVPALVDAGYRAITYDRRGFGRSDKAPDGYEYDTMASDLNELMTQLDLTDAALVGFSMGGGEVARYIGTYGESRLAGAVLAAAITPALCITDDNPDGGMPMEGFAGLRDECRGDRQGFLEKFMTWFFSNPSELTITEDQFRDVIRITGQGADKALQDTIIAWATDFRDDVAKFTVPTLVIHGDSDNNVPFPPSGKRSAEMIPGARLHVIAGGPHGINTSHADEFNRVLLEFLGSL